MKYFGVLLAGLFLSTSLLAQTQKDPGTFRFGLKVGGNLSMFSASVNSEPSMKPGFHAGVYMRHSQANGRFHVRPEVYFSSQGQKDHYVTGSQSRGNTETTINALNMPVLVEVGRKLTFQVGPQFGILLTGREKGTIDSQPINQDLKKGMRGADFSIVLGVGFYPTEKLNLGIRYNYGITSVFEDPTTIGPNVPTFANRVIHFYLSTSF